MLIEFPDTSRFAKDYAMNAQPDTRLHGRWLVAAQAAWGIIVALALILFIAAMPMTYRRLSAPPATVQTWLAQLGLSLSFYTAYMMTLQVVFGLACLVMA